MKEKFTPEEWESLKLLPLQIFAGVAGADGLIERSEVAQLLKNLHDYTREKERLHKELLDDILSSDLMGLLKEAMDFIKFKERVYEIKDVLKKKLSPEEYQKFVEAIFINGIWIARASGGYFETLDKNVSDHEQLILSMFAAIFELDVEDVSKYFG